MIHYKNSEEIELMRHGGKILSEVLWEVMDAITPGITEIEIDALADKLILEKGGEVAFKKVRGYKYATCISTNNVVVHGIPTDYALKEGDLIGVDCGVLYKGFNTDMSHSIRVSASAKKKNDDEVDKFLAVGEKALDEAIKQAIVGNKIGHISKKIQDIIEKENGYSIVRSLIGHGVGRKLHEDPEVPGFLDGKIEKTPLLKAGMTIAVEIIYNMGSAEVSFYNKDGWTIGTSDGALSGLFERTIAILDNGPEILT